MTALRGAVSGRFAACAALALALAALAVPVRAQGLDLGGGDSNAPIEIFAENGIEWQQNNEVLIARGNARAVRDGVTVHADVLRAYYKDTGGGSELHRLDAAGNVRIVSEGESIVGDGAVYDLEQAILVVSGDKVVYRSGKDVITANKQMEYYERAMKAVARGGAVAVHEGKRMSAETLEAHFRKTSGGQSEIHEVRAFDDVAIVTAQDVVRANRGIYDVRTERATLVGDVRITRGDNQLAGDQAQINMKTGVSRLLTNTSRVRGIIVPQKREADTKGRKSKGGTTK